MKKNLDEKLLDAFLGISDKKLLDKDNIKKQAQYQKDVKSDCDSIININLGADYMERASPVDRDECFHPGSRG